MTDTFQKEFNLRQKYFSAFKHYDDFYKNVVEKNSKYVKALTMYKQGNSYKMSGILQKKCEISMSELYQMIRQLYPKNSTEVKKVLHTLSKGVYSDKIHEKIKQLYYQLNIKKLKKIIYIFDEMILRSPGIQKSTTVYRGMSYDIFSKIYKQGNKYYFESDNFFATSYDPNWSLKFIYDKECCFYSILLPKGTKGIFMVYLDSNIKTINNSIIDFQREFLLPRNSIFEVVKQDNFLDIKNDHGFTHAQRDIFKKFSKNKKHYILKYIKINKPQPLISEKKNDYILKISPSYID